MWQTTRQCSSRGNAAFLEALRTDPDGCKNPNYPCGTLDTLKQRYAESGQIKMTVHTLIWNPMLHFAAGAAICAEGRAAFNLDRLYGTTVTGGYTNYKELVLATLELSEDDMKACAPTIKKEMEKIYATSMTLARELGITAVPSFVIGDKQLVGPSSNEEIFKFIDDALATE
jgi:protein-disulfide isomerase